MARLPHIRAPMAATQVARSFHRPGWIYEEKVDGWHVLAYKDAAGVRLVSRNARDLTRRFPELAAAVAELKPPTLILDGEIAVFDRQLLSHFEWIRARPKDAAATPPTLLAFDCLYVRGKDLRKRPLRVRRNVLEELVSDQRLILPARRLAEDGLEAWAQVIARLRGPGREGRHLSLRGGPHALLAEGEGAALPGGRAGLGAQAGAGMTEPGRAGASRAPAGGPERRRRPGPPRQSPGYTLGISPGRAPSTPPSRSKSRETLMLTDRRSGRAAGAHERLPQGRQEVLAEFFSAGVPSPRLAVPPPSPS